MDLLALSSYSSSWLEWRLSKMSCVIGALSHMKGACVLLAQFRSERDFEGKTSAES